MEGFSWSLRFCVPAFVPTSRKGLNGIYWRLVRLRTGRRLAPAKSRTRTRPRACRRSVPGIRFSRPLERPSRVAPIRAQERHGRRSRAWWHDSTGIRPESPRIARSAFGRIVREAREADWRRFGVFVIYLKVKVPFHICRSSISCPVVILAIPSSGR